MFEPTEGCPHLQPIELMALAEKTTRESQPEGPLEGQKVLVSESVAGHMFPCVKTTLTWNGSSWMVSEVQRLLRPEGDGVKASLLD